MIGIFTKINFSSCLREKNSIPKKLNFFLQKLVRNKKKTSQLRRKYTLKINSDLLACAGLHT